MTNFNGTKSVTPVLWNRSGLSTVRLTAAVRRAKTFPADGLPMEVAVLYEHAAAASTARELLQVHSLHLPYFVVNCTPRCFAAPTPSLEPLAVTGQRLGGTARLPRRSQAGARARYGRAQDGVAGVQTSTRKCIAHGLLNASADGYGASPLPSHPPAPLRTLPLYTYYGRST